MMSVSYDALLSPRFTAVVRENRGGPAGNRCSLLRTTFFDDGWTSSSFMMKYWWRRYWCRISRHGGRSLRGSLGEFVGNLEPSRANFEETGVRNKHGNEDVGCLDLHG